MATGDSMNREEREDHGQLVRAPRIHRIWAWIFPAIAAAAGIWLLWSNWKSQGPEIEIHFAEAPGIEAGKTALIYRGVTSGRVTGVRLDTDLGGVQVKVRLKAFASNLARKNSSFWIDQPVISIRQTTGLDAIIQGNSIQAEAGDGPETRSFQGLSEAPLEPLDGPAMVLRLRASDIPFLARGTPVYRRGVRVGIVRDKAVDEQGKPFLQILINEAHAGLVRTTSRFWMLPATSVTVGTQGVTLSLPGLEALVDGGIAFDEFSGKGEVAKGGMDFHLAPTELAARMDGPEIALTFDDARGLQAGATTIRFSGFPIGLVESVRLDTKTGTVRATARIGSDFFGLAREGSVLRLVRPEASLAGVTGLDTLLTGVYIEWEPGTGAAAMEFAVRSGNAEAWDQVAAEKGGVEVLLGASTLPRVDAGTLVFFRGLVAGRVTEKFRDASGAAVLRVVVRKDFRNSLNTKSRFWFVPAFSVTAGPGVLDVKVESLEAALRGGLAFDNFGDGNEKRIGVEDGAKFTLFASESAARAVSPALRILLPRGQGLLAGKTQLRRLGVPVGLVESVRPVGTQVEVIARFDAGYDDMRRKGAEFAIVQPQLSLQGMTGIETLVSGVYIECVPGTGAFAETFTAKVEGQPELLNEESGFLVNIVTPKSTIQAGAPVTYRDVAVGRVVEKNLSADGAQVILTVGIDANHRDLVRENTVFWDASGVLASVGFLKLRIPGQSIVAPDGKISFATPGIPGRPARTGQEFLLSDRPVPLR